MPVHVWYMLDYVVRPCLKRRWRGKRGKRRGEKVMEEGGGEET